MPGSPSFARFDERARRGERLTVAFFGASLTWGANASDPQQRSYRANIARRFETAYPEAHFRFVDAAIGGTGSQLAVFRLDRDVLAHEPDLVFLDFSANDDLSSADPETLASYESLLRRLVIEAGAPVVQVAFPFMWDAQVDPAVVGDKPRLAAHEALSRSYGAGFGNAVQLARQRLHDGAVRAEDLWPYDQVHPGDAGYELFADAAWGAYLDAVAAALRCRAPTDMIYADTYMTRARVRISSLGDLPRGWSVDRPNVTSAWYDALMSRWLDDVVVAAGPAATLRLRINASMILLFGEETPLSGKYRLRLDGEPVWRGEGEARTDVIDASSSQFGGNRQHAHVAAAGLSTDVDHILEIEPMLDDDAQELRLESVCVAGGTSSVSLASR